MQISPIEYFAQDQEPLPQWLKDHKASTPVNIQELFSSRIVYNPGAGMEGSPIYVFNSAHAAHVFVYVDYGVTKATVDQELSDEAFRGYHLHHQQEVSEKELAPRSFTYHLTAEELREAREQSAYVLIPEPNGFGILKIYERDENLGEEHGAWRFAVLYLGADAIAAYDVLFGNTSCTPYASVVDSYSFGNAYAPFTVDSILEKIAVRSDRLPKYLLSPRGGGWNGYRMLKTVSGTYGRFVWVKDNGDVTHDGFDEDLRRILVFADEG
jgi:hypothetical protein